jgi:hypothetical protein
MIRLVNDTLVVAERNLVRLPRSPDLLLAVTVQPVMFVLLFVYVFGGAINTPGYDNYKDFLIPGIIVQNIAFGGFLTALGLAEDMNKGLIDRFRSLPMARPAVLAGRTTADIVTNLLSIVVLVTTGLIIGFSFDAGVGEILLGVLLLLCFGYAFSWVFALVGLLVSSPEAANSVGFIAVPADVHLLRLRARGVDAVGAADRRGGQPVHRDRRRDALAMGRGGGRKRGLGRLRLDGRDLRGGRSPGGRAVPESGVALRVAVARATAAYAVRGIARHRTFGSTGFDLGLFDQVLWHAGRLERPRAR